MISIVSKKQLSQIVNVAEDDDRFDKVLLQLAKAASALIEDYLGRSLVEADRVEYHQSWSSDQYTPRTEAQLIWVNAYPIREGTLS